ncbi:MAG: hypothetical protein L0Y80_03410, partial [Ignavibacteriae bacterium]|nr:hypothetical protein [Ignavibacteriota bacterium]
MHNKSTILQDILSRLERVRRLQLITDAQSSALIFASTFLLALTFLSLLEIVGHFSSTVRTVLALLFGAIALALLAWYVVRPLLRLVGILPTWDNFTVAKKVGGRFPNVLDRMLNLLQLHREMDSGKSLYSPELVDASFQDLQHNVTGLDFATTADRSPVGRAAQWFALTVVGVALLGMGLSSSLYGAADRLVHFTAEYTQPAKYSFEVLPGNDEVVKGSDVEILVNVTAQESSGIPSSGLRLATRLEGQAKFDDIAMRADSDTPDMFRATLAGIRGSTEYFVHLDDAQSDMFQLTVLDRPVLRSLQVKLDYPSYTRLPTKTQDEFVGDVTALAGTRVTIKGTASKTLGRGRLVLKNEKAVPLIVRREQFSASFVLKSDDEYVIEVQDNEELTNKDPVNYTLKVILDEVPAIAITQPGRNVDLAGSESLPLIVEIQDDFGFSKLQLGYRLAHSRYELPSENPTFIQLPLPQVQGARVEIPYRWDLAPLSLVPEDVVEYFAEVFDNDVVSGPKSARSQTYLLRLPSLEEVFTDADKGHEQSLDDLKQAMEEAKKLKENLESINQDFKKNKEFDWQEQKKLEEMAKKYQEMQKKLDEVKSRVDEMVQKMEDQNVLSQETLEKYLELQEIFEQLNSEELQKMMKQMQQAMQNVDRNKLQQALEQMTFSEERFRQSIERTMNLLKRIQVEQKMDEATKRAEDIKQQQGEIQQQSAESQGDQQKTEELAKQQENLAGKQEKLQELMEELQRRMEEFFTEMPADKLQELNKQLQQQQLPQTMQQSAQMMRQGQQQQAQQQQAQQQQ